MSNALTARRRRAAARLSVDNLKAGITKACFYEPTVNRTYADMAAHLPHRDHPCSSIQRGCDKAKVEVGVQVVAALGSWRGCANRRFFSLGS